MRRLRVGDIRRLLRHRYGPTLPDDDAGREDLIELLKPISLGADAAKAMRHEIEVVAPFIDGSAERVISYVRRMPICERSVKATVLGERLRVTNAERERLRLWSIRPVDMSSADLAEQRKAKKRARARSRRRKRGSVSRPQYQARFANSDRKRKPWKAEGISRRTWFRRRASIGDAPGAKSVAPDPCQANIIIGGYAPGATELAEPQLGIQEGHLARPSPHHRRANGNSHVGKVTGADRDDDAMRKKCREGTARYAAALNAAGYDLRDEALVLGRVYTKDEAA